MPAPTRHSRPEPVEWRRLGLALAGTLLAVCVLTPLFELLGAPPRKASQETLRVAMMAMIAVIGARARRSWARDAGIAGPGHPAKRWIAGFLFGGLGLGIYSLTLWILGERQSAGVARPWLTALACLKYVPLAFAIGWLEDLLFFGLLYRVLGGRALACALIYAWSHFIKIDKQAPFGPDVWKHGIEAIAFMGQSLAGVLDEGLEGPGLVVVGWVLATMRRSSGTLWFGMGVHGGWYFVRSAGRKFTKDVEGQHESLFGSDLYYDGLLVWLLLAATGAAGALWFRRLSALEEGHGEGDGRGEKRSGHEHEGSGARDP
jgi:uncharacterized protein